MSTKTLKGTKPPSEGRKEGVRNSLLLSKNISFTNNQIIGISNFLNRCHKILGENKILSNSLQNLKGVFLEILVKMNAKVIFSQL